MYLCRGLCGAEEGTAEDQASASEGHTRPLLQIALPSGSEHNGRRRPRLTTTKQAFVYGHLSRQPLGPGQ